MPVADPGGGAGVPPSLTPLGVFFFFKSEVYEQKKLVLNEYEICLKILEMAILETQIFKNIESSHLQRSWCPLLEVQDPSLNALYTILTRE